MKGNTPHGGRSVSCNGRRSARSGFTLMEVLLVTILSAVLMVGLWSLFGTYIRLFESGPERTERAQLLRALKQQFSDDLRGAIQISQIPAESATETTFATESAAGEFGGDGTFAPVAPIVDSSSGTSALPRFGIVGTAQSLAIVSLQIPADSLTPPSTADAPVDFSELTTGLAPELKTILYSFTETRKQSPLDHGPPPGLLRRELDWRTVLSDRMFASATEFGVAETPAADDAEEFMADDSTTWVPEVVDLQIRYFGEGRWQSSWDSLRKKTLPSAVEIVIELKAPANRKAEADAEREAVADYEETDSGQVDEVVLDNEVESGFITAADSRKPRHRILIYLPGGVSAAPPRSMGFPAAESSALPGGAP